MKEELLLPTLRRLLTEIVRLRFKDQYERHRQMREHLADQEIRLKISDMEQLVIPLLGPADTERVILAALKDARDPNLP
ncbi:hypothetical protein [Deinococcus misasensis]|uniref:hypothetical protein n=1 Tax=Deinococcus misasensis TaxID=392413 RepID=UPI00054FDB24|nr:hypothetical protein [Deinococcus misasensis]